MLEIVNGRVYDPANGVDGRVQDIWIEDGRIVPPDGSKSNRAEIIDARGLVVMPGGVDIHSHIAGHMVNASRAFRPEDHRADPLPRTALRRSGTGYSLPTTFATGYRYLEMGYTTVMEAAMPPMLARHTHEELNDIPLLDKGAYVVMGNNHFLMRCLGDGERSKARDFVAWLLGATKGYAVKVVNAGGVENWKQGQGITGLDDEVIGFGLTPRQIIVMLADISAELGLPHGPHIHTNLLGQPGNVCNTLRTIEALAGRRAHLCHVQFSSYGGGHHEPLRSAATEVARAIDAHPNITVDVGQIVFGSTTTMTCDGPLQHRLHCLTADKWLNHDLEEETGGGAVPLIYRRRNVGNAVQWCIGLELLLLVQDPWRIFLTTDHPNAGPFTAYPEVIRLVMDRNYRAQVLETLPPRVRRRTCLAELSREYSLYEIAVITRAGTARALGLRRKGHLGIGADADVAVYAPGANAQEMFGRARFVVKDGRVVVREGQVTESLDARTFCVAPAWDRQVEKHIRVHLENEYTIAFDNYPVQDDCVPRCEVVPCT